MTLNSVYQAIKKKVIFASQIYPVFRLHLSGYYSEGKSSLNLSSQVYLKKMDLLNSNYAAIPNFGLTRFYSGNKL
jgi:hypothetical protein